MKFWSPSAPDHENETDQAEMLEAYTQWINGEKLSEKQKKYLQRLSSIVDEMIMEYHISYFKINGEFPDGWLE